MQKSDYQIRLWHTVVAVITFTELVALGMLAYLGTFTRFLADDYCEMINIHKAPLLVAVFQNYMSGRIRAANRFSHLLLVGWSEMLGKYNVRIVPGLMIVLWMIGLVWTLGGARRLVGGRQNPIMDWFLASTLIFFSAWQAPNRFQTFFWRSSVTTHFAPFVLMFLLSGFILHQIRLSQRQLPPLWAVFIVFISAFIIGGVAEPVTTVMLASSVLPLIYVWQQKALTFRRSALILLTTSSVGTFLALCALFFAPGNLLYGETSVGVLPQAMLKSFWYSLQFVWDTLITLPVPTLISVLIPTLLFFSFGADILNGLADQRRSFRFSLWSVPLIHFLFIAVSFFPSAYGQSYPEERARFVGRFFMTSALVLEGVLLGIWLAQWKKMMIHWQPIFWFSVIVLLGLGLYPLRAAASMLNDVKEYKAWASAWDKRETAILTAHTSGELNVVVRWLPNRYGVKDLDGSVTHWINSCAAQYYGVSTIRSVPGNQ